MLPAPSVGRRALVFAALGLAFATSSSRAPRSRASTSSAAPTCSAAARSAPPVRTKSSSARPTSPSTRPTHATASSSTSTTPRSNAQGKVEFSADIYIIKPKDPARGNGVLFFDIVNRGNKALLGVFSRGARVGRPDDGSGLRRRLICWSRATRWWRWAGSSTSRWGRAWSASRRRSRPTTASRSRAGCGCRSSPTSRCPPSHICRLQHAALQARRPAEPEVPADGARRHVRAAAPHPA